MAVEELPGGGFVVTGEHIPIFQLVTLASALSIEAMTTMKMSRGQTAVQVAKNLGLIPADKRSSPKKALAAVVAKIKELDPGYTPNSSVQKALDS